MDSGLRLTERWWRTIHIAPPPLFGGESANSEYIICDAMYCEIRHTIPSAI